MFEYLDDNLKMGVAIFANVIFFATSFLLGRICVSGFKFRRRATGVLLSLILGMDVLCLLGLLIGNKLDSKLFFLFILLFIFVIFTGKLRVKDNDASLKNRISTGDIFAKFRFDYSLLPLVIVCLLVLGRTLSPPTSWDELTYQLAVPVRWLEGRGNEIFADNPYSAFPSLSGIAFRILISTGGFIASRISVLFLFVFSALSLHSLISPLSTRFAKFALMTAFCTSFPVLMISSSAYSEIFILANFAVAMLLFQEKEYFVNKNGYIQLAVLCGILSGATGSVKLTGLFMLPVLLIFLFSNKRPQWRNIVMPIFFLFSALIFGIFFYMRPFILSGNLFHPYFAWLFSSDPAIVEMSRYHHAIGSVKYGIGGLSGFIFSPFFLVFGIGPFDGLIGFQYLPIIVLGLVVFWILLKRAEFFSFRFQCFLVGFFLYVFWFFTSNQSRFIVPAIFAITVASASMISSVKNKKNLAIVIIALSLISIPTKFLKDCFISWKVVLGTMRRIDYIYSATGPGYLKACDMIGREKVKDKKVMLLFEHRGLYIPSKYLIATPFFQSQYFTPPERMERDDIVKILEDEKITHILIGLSSQDPDRLADYLDRSAKIAKILGELEDNGTIKKIWEDEGFALFVNISQ